MDFVYLSNAHISSVLDYIKTNTGKLFKATHHTAFF